MKCHRARNLLVGDQTLFCSGRRKGAGHETKVFCTVYIAYMPTVLLEYTNLQLGCIEYYCYLYACE